MSNSQSSGKDAYMSVQIVVLDHYQAEPLEGLDPLTSDRGYDIRRVPILRVFGATPAGQKTTLHIHGIFPYLYVPMPEKENDGFHYRLATALDLAINTSLNHSKATVQHVYKAIKVSGRPFYGYHPRQHNFIKIFFYQPSMVKRASDLLSGGLVLGKSLQPHEAHVPFKLQFLMDYNLQGMNLINLKHVMFRQGALVDEYDSIEPFENLRQLRPSNQDLMDETMSTPHTKMQKIPPADRYYDPQLVHEVLKLPAVLTRMSTSELEVDAVAADILNSLDYSGGAMNPGLKCLWEDERERRLILKIPDQLTPPGSPPRPDSANEGSESNNFWLERFDKMLTDKKEREGDDSMYSVEESSDPDATFNLRPPLGFSESAGETTEKELSFLPPATQLESHVPTLSDSILGLSPSQCIMGTPKRSQTSSLDFLEDTLLDDLEESQDSSLGSSDEEFADMLADMVDEHSPINADVVDEPSPKITDLVDKVEDFPTRTHAQDSVSRTPASELEDLDSVVSPERPKSQAVIASQNILSSSFSSINSPGLTNSQKTPTSPLSNSQKAREPEIEDIFSNSLCLSETEEDYVRPSSDDDIESLEMSQAWWGIDDAFKEPSKDTAEKADSQNRKEDNSPKAEDKGENLESSLWGVDDDELMQTLGLEDF